VRLEPIIEHPAVVCVQCHRCVIEGIVYADTDVVTNDIYCRQCADEPCHCLADCALRTEVQAVKQPTIALLF
jgi:hypothetical protein